MIKENKKLKEFFFKDNIHREGMPILFGYVLEHSIDINVLIKEEKNKLENGYMYLSVNNSKRLVLK